MILNYYSILLLLLSVEQVTKNADFFVYVLKFSTYVIGNFRNYIQLNDWRGQTYGQHLFG